MNRKNNEPRIGIVLSSGGARGVFAHTGFLQAVQELEINVAALAGCSAGALVGGIYASGTDLAQWSNTLAGVTAHDYWAPDSKARFLWNMVVKKGRGYTGFSSSQAGTDFIRRNLTAQTFDACMIPFYSLAMNLTCGTKKLFSEGELAPRIMASAAIPILFRPVEIEKELFSDGATLELAPTDAICCKHKLDILLVHHTAMPCKGKAGLQHALEQPWSLLELLFMQLYSDRPWYLTSKPVNETFCQCGCGARVIVLQPALPESRWPLRGEGVALQESARLQNLILLDQQIKKWSV